MKKIKVKHLFSRHLCGKEKNVNKYVMIIIIKVVEHCKPNTVDSVYDLT